MKKNDEPVVVEQSFDQPIDLLWRAVTEIDQMRSWFFENIPAFKPEVGFETGFDVQSQRRNFHHLWRVTEVIPNRKLTYQWKYREYPGDSFVTFELSTEDGKTKLTLTALVVEDFPDDIPEFRRESCLAGWTYFIQDRLKTFLDRYR